MSSTRKRISILCPVYNEEETIQIFYDRLQKALASVLDRYDFEIVFLNNRSTDRSLSILRELRARDPAIQVLTMSRNFGYQPSVQAGMSYATGDGIVVIDSDCEDPPELILDFLAKWEEGYDVVFGIRKDRAEHWAIKKLRNVFYHILRATADMNINLYMAEFALISSVVRDSIINNRNTFPFLRAEIGYVGFSGYGIEYNRQPRVAGKTHYNLTRMVAFAMAGFLTSSTFLMRLAGYFFPVLVAVNAVLLAWSVHGGSSAAFQILVAADLVYAIFFLTVQGVYLARVYKNGMGQPIFIVDAKESAADAWFLDRSRKTSA